MACDNQDGVDERVGIQVVNTDDDINAELSRLLRKKRKKLFDVNLTEDKFVNTIMQANKLTLDQNKKCDLLQCWK